MAGFRFRGCVSLSAKPALVRWGAVLLSAVIYIYLGGRSRTESEVLQVGWAALFVLYLAANAYKGWSWRSILVAGLLLRLIQFAWLPVLSEDVYRFLWDGLLWQMGEHPILCAPDSYLEEALSSAQLYLLHQMNSASYLSLYPPLHQWVFYLATVDYGGAAEGIFRMRLLHLLAEVGVLWIMGRCCRQRGLEMGLLGWYFLHPLPILEGVANLHFEPYVLFFLLLALWAMSARRWVLGAGALAIAVATKLLPLLLLPLFLFRLYRQEGRVVTSIFLLSFVLGLLLLFAPLGYEEMFRARESLLLYINTFEFNASLYFLLRGLGEFVWGYNPIRWLGPVLAVLGGLGILYFSFSAARRQLNMAEGALVCLAIYFLCSTTVHPWYLVPILGLGVVAQRRWPLLWAYLALYSYIGYQEKGYQHPYLWIAVEYGLLLLFFGWRMGVYRRFFQ